MPSASFTETNIVSPKFPEVSAYFAAQSFSSGAYGASSAAEFANLVYTVDAIVAALNARKVTSAS
jgi:hypothetical protein